MYDEFVESFKAEDENTTGIKTFVRGETVQPGSRPDQSKEGPQKGGKYVPSFMPPGMAEALSGKNSKEAGKASFSTGTKLDKKAPRAIDMVLEEMKRDQAARVERNKNSGFDIMPGDPNESNFGDSDPFTTNLYVGNLAPEVDEQVLKAEFIRFGPIASVKIMWPRTEEERTRGRNCGFVAFMDRNSAVDAREEMNGTVLHSYDLRIGWGKAVQLPSIPLYDMKDHVLAGAPAAAAGKAAIPPPGTKAAIPPPGTKAAIPPPGTPMVAGLGGGLAAGGGPHGGGNPSIDSQVTFSQGLGGRGLVPPGPPPPPPMASSPQAMLAPSGPDVEIRIPENPRQSYVIDITAKFVVQDGCPFEQKIMEQERDNPDFAFLFSPNSPEHAYYRWRLFSLANGDSLTRWRTAPFIMLAGGARWCPPPQSAANPMHQAGIGGPGAAPKPLAAQSNSGPMLTDDEADEFENLLRRLSMERNSIKEGMAFALDHADASSDIVETLTEALTLSETPISTKVARLYLVSDILHNSSGNRKNASTYRTLFESNLPEIFESLCETQRGAGGRIAQEELKRRVFAVLRAWGDWFLFPEAYLSGLQATFMRIALKTSEEGKTLKADLAVLTNEDIERKCRRNGVTFKGGRDSCIDRLDPADLAALAAGIGLSGYGSGSDDEDEDPVEAAAEDRTDLAELRQANTSVSSVASDPVPQAPQKQDLTPSAPVSRWSMDYDSEDSDDEAGGSGITGAPLSVGKDKSSIYEQDSPPPPTRSSTTPTGPAEASGGERKELMNEEERQKKRKLELAVEEFRIQLEDDGLSKVEIETRVEEFRKKQNTSESGSSGRSKSKDREKEKIKEKEKNSGKEREKERERSKDKEKEREKEKKEREREREKKEREREKKEKERERERSKEKERDKNNSSSGSARKRGRSRSRSRSRERHVKEKDRDHGRDHKARR
eukprot:gene14233-16837_t